MKEELLKTIEYLSAYADALQSGFDNFIKALPVYTQQQLKAEAKKRLNSTVDHYIKNTRVKMTDYVLIVGLNRDDWLTMALESGVGAFDMKQKMLKSSKAKTSKAGFRYVSIPIGKSKGAHAGTEKAQEFQKKINDVLQAPKYGVKKLKTLMTGHIVESQQVLSDDPMMKGLYRTRTFTDAAAYHGNKAVPWQHVMFRTMSENPESLSKWEHPGIRPVNVLRSMERWLERSVEPLLESFLQSEISSINAKLR